MGVKSEGAGDGDRGCIYNLESPCFVEPRRCYSVNTNPMFISRAPSFLTTILPYADFASSSLALWNMRLKLEFLHKPITSLNII